MISEVATTLIDIIDPDDGSVQVPKGTTGVVTGVAGVSDLTAYFAVGSVTHIVLFEHLDFDNGDLGKLRAFLVDGSGGRSILAVGRPEPNYDGIVEITFSDGLVWRFESDRASGNLIHYFS